MKMARNPGYKTGDWAYEDLTDRLLSAGVKFEKEIPTKTSPLLSLLVSWMLPIFFFLFLGNMLSKKLAGMGGNAMTFENPTPRSTPKPRRAKPSRMWRARMRRKRR